MSEYYKLKTRKEVYTCAYRIVRALAARMAVQANAQEQKRHGSTQRKIYKAQECILTSNLGSRNIYAVGVFNSFTVHTFFVPFALLLLDSRKAGRLYMDMSRFYALFGPPSEWLTVAVIVFLEFILTFIVYFSFKIWAAFYRRYGHAVNTPFLLLFVACILISHYAVFYAVFDVQLHPAGRVICCVQQVILYMKWISFVNENAYKVLHPWHKDDETGPAVWYAGQMDPQIGSFSAYTFFLFCPVLLYRDRYPRKPPNFMKALAFFLQFLMSTLLAYVTFTDYLVTQSMHLDDLLASFLRCVFLGLLQLSLGHTCLMHGWFNAWAELLGFADHGFYQDWWNSKSLTEYLSKWNPMVQEWLKSYIHRYLKKSLPRFLALLVVLILSALEHDLLIGAGLGFFIPMYLIEYGIGGILLSLKRPLGEWTDQMIMCAGLSLGSGIQIAIYCTEIASHTHCPKQNTSFFEGLRMIDCYKRFN